MSSYGCYYHLFRKNGYPRSCYLPQVGLDIHALVLSNNTRTTITQTFINPSKTKPIPELLYSFPLYDGSSIVGFACHIGDRVIRGQVKPKKKAEEAYQKAKSKGQTAAIFDQSADASDVFKTRLGNVPAGAEIKVHIILVQESKQDTQTDGIRYTVPITIAPRYGTQRDVQTSDIPEAFAIKTEIKVDLSMEKESHIRNVRSPTHPIEVTIGRTSIMPETTSEPCYASVKLRENVVIQEDFVVTVGSSNKDLPFAFLETHPTLPNQRAMMVSLTPKFGLPQSTSEIIFVIDRSGSMGDKIGTLQNALEVFLKSFPLGIHFNIVSFGSTSTSLWPRSKMCDRKNLTEALEYTKKIQADMGGTEILDALKYSMSICYKDKVPEVLLLTDGEVWDQQGVFDFVKKAVKEKSARFFTLGIGSAVSHSLIGGISRAGMGFSQSVQNYEELNKTVVRMLKGALMARVTDAVLDMKMPDLEKEDFMMVEPVEENPKRKQSSTGGTRHKLIKLFDHKFKESDKLENVHQPLPTLTTPSIIQAPTEIPPLFPSIRSTVYVLFSGEVSSLPETIKLRANSEHGPLELDIPVQDIGQSDTIHQLAAKRAMGELEEGHGWIHNARDANGTLIANKWESRVDELVQNECERLGVRFQIAGQHCSFVAIQDSDEDAELDYVKSSAEYYGSAHQINHETLQRTTAPARAMSMACYAVLPTSQEGRVSGYSRLDPRNLFMRTAPDSAMVPAGGELRQTSQEGFMGDDDSDYIDEELLEEEEGLVQEVAEMPDLPSNDDTSGLHTLISLQTFDGYWEWQNELFHALGLDPESTQAKLQARYQELGGKNSDIFSLPVWKIILATRLVSRFLETKLSDSEDVWELLKGKADNWVQNSLNGMNEEDQLILGELVCDLRFCF